MLYTVYKTVNLSNGKYYFGVHKTENPDDDYLGSGNYIRRAITKYGELGFRKDVLFTYLDPESAFAKEDELIQCYRGRDSLCMNLRKGGSGGFDWINKNGLSGHKLGTLRMNEVLKRRYHTDAEYQKRVKSGSPRSPLIIKGNTLWVGRHHTEETKVKMRGSRPSMLGNKNPRFGKFWITRKGVNRIIDKRDFDTLVNEGWIKGRVV